MTTTPSQPSVKTLSSQTEDDNNETTCHILPCNIDFQGMAPNHLYFRPSKIIEVDDEAKTDKDDAAATGGGGDCSISSAMFRGRGLLAKTNGENIPAALLAIDTNTGKVQIKTSTTKIMEWHHEHLPETLKYSSDNNAGGGSSRIQYAQEWIEVSDALHASIPVDPPSQA